MNDYINRQCEYWDSESNHCALCRPSAQPIDAYDWTELMVICDNCGHAIHIKKEEQK